MHQIREELADKAQKYRDSMKQMFDKKSKPDNFKIGDLVLRWDARNEEKGKHGKFDSLWMGPFQIYSIMGKKLFFLQDLKGIKVGSGPVNGRFLKHYLA